LAGSGASGFLQVFCLATPAADASPVGLLSGRQAEPRLLEGNGSRQEMEGRQVLIVGREREKAGYIGMTHLNITLRRNGFVKSKIISRFKMFFKKILKKAVI